MKFNKLIFILGLPLIAQLLFSCTCCDCDDDPIIIETNEPCVFEKIEVDFLDNSGVMPVVTNKDSISRKAFGIQIDLNFNQDYCFQSNFNTSLFPTAQAFSCGCDNVAQIEPRVSHIEIVALNPFNNSEIDSVITTRFKILRFNTYYELTDNNVSTSQPFDIILTEVPDTAQNHQFLIKYSTSDSTYSDTTKMIYLL